ncbi:hypothetical protein TCAL_08457 [Tigriopus californicus]|uniref:Uncharacterized protein n=1 Tax=Tigriopus californicus TaxID=6832 RepID=A0A553N835_TIGCA|nr:hypothetical protein TCAL_08457 [Tigriopus californicus]|eukprot:TCALIF_08457-PA protein Name:"Protein of unknown function" AED:0.41 eAED:0.46 QI:0/-1/0/1/-1/1/1/0/112
MAHTTNVYYRDRLGFEPDYEPHRASQYATSSTSIHRESHYLASSSTTSVSGGMSGSKAKKVVDSSGRIVEETKSSLTGGVYEENLTKFKGRPTAIHGISRVGPKTKLLLVAS